MKTGLLSRPALLGFVVAFAAAHASAETFYVTVDDSGFSPSTLNIQVGDTVVWVNNDEFFPHTTTSDLSLIHPDYWYQTLDEHLQEYPKTFGNPGTFNYRDEVTLLTGTIIVSSPTTTEIVLTAPRIESGKFVFEASGLTPGRENVLLVTTNFVQWTGVATNLAASTSMTFTNTPTSPARFYRLLELP